MSQNIACYIRLSLADGDLSSYKDESNSIKNQRDLIHAFLDKHEEFKEWTVLEFVDDGYTGTNTDRPQFQKMLELTKQGQIQCIVVKDLSRFARNYVVCGEYIEEVFPFLGVRFIAINDNYDSSNGNTIEDNMSMVLKSVLNAYYSKDISRKITASLHQRMKQGIYRGNAPFGYIRPRGSYTYQLDPEASKIVRRAYDLALEGKSTREIANTLNAEKHMTPALYIRRQNSDYRKHRLNTEDPIWDTNMVLTVLRNPSYTGDLVMRKNTSIVPGAKKKRKTTAEEQIRKPNSHPAIVSHEEFDKVQKLFPVRQNAKYHPPLEFPLRGVVRCGYCKRSMALRSNRIAFSCSHARLEHSKCDTTTYPMSEIEEIVMASLRPMLEIAATSDRQSSKKKEANRMDFLLQCQKDISAEESMHRHIQIKKLEIYEDYTAGALSLSAYQEEKEALIKKDEQCLKKLETLRSQEAAFQNGIVPHDVQTVTDSVRKFRHSTALSREMVQAFVKHVDCYSTHYEITWNHQDVWAKIIQQQKGEIELNEQIKRKEQ